MNNTITIEQLKELLKIQKTFDDRIPTLNLHDTKVAFMVEFFEWFNTIETFKNWKSKPGKPKAQQLDELADVLAFALSILNQTGYSERRLEEVVRCLNLDTRVSFKSEESTSIFLRDFGIRLFDGCDLYWLSRNVDLPFEIARSFYSFDELIEAYRNKMKRNHDRQDGKADKDKGYV